MFTVSFSELESRLEPEYYTPDLRNLENIVRKQSDHKLRHYIRGISSGATPSTTQPKKYYTDKENGYPFLRVQNLQINGKLNFNNLKYINEKTHNGKLQRSQVEEGDLLIKITGVGRMAIASVAPEGFVGNTNQHMVVVKTESRGISEYLANYLNLDLVETLASRRATGATRPALDYQALKSIPIIEGLDFGIIEEAYQTKAQKEAEAKELLNSIDDYLLSELGIEVPEKDNSLENRIFTTSFQSLSGMRCDPNYHSKYLLFKSINPKYSFVKLREALEISPQYGANETAIDGNPNTDTRYLRITDIDDNGNLKNDSWQTAEKIEEKYLLENNDILFARSGSVGRCFLYKKKYGRAIFAGYLIRFKLNEKILLPEYLFYYANSSFFEYWVSMIKRPTTQANINSEEFMNLPIPTPTIKKQKEIVDTISRMRNKAKQLKEEAERAVEEARRQVEEMILEEDSVSA
jgi:restriction endonuclease S subunit